MSSYTENSNQHANVNIDHAPSADASDDEDGGEYDPESVTITTVSEPIVERPASDSPRPSKKPKTAGGFVVDDSSDEEDDIPAPTSAPAPAPAPVPAPAPAPAPSYSPSTLKSLPAEASAQPFSHPPLQQITTPQDMITGTLAQASDDPVSTVATSNVATANAARLRLPTDIVGILEDRIKKDPRGDLEAWLALIDEQKRRHKIEDTRAVYERFLKVFPHAAEIWVQYIDMELSLDNSTAAEQIFLRTLEGIPNVQLWTTYLNYIRRRNDLNDPTGRARQTISQSYEFVLGAIGQDRDAGGIWQDYIQFIKSGPGQVGGAGWQDQQKMDVLRKAYQRAVAIPMANVNSLWKEYDHFEMGLNKMTGRKFIQERSPSYMSARSANTHLENITRGLQRTTLPRLPPAPGFEGDQEYLEQVRLWKTWIAWEKDDPLSLSSDEPDIYRQRVLCVYKQALMALRFWPELWVDAADWCFDNGIIGKNEQDTGLQFLIDGLEANPESSLIALKHADRIESTQATPEDDAGKAALVLAVRQPCDRVLDTLYGMIKNLKDEEAAAVAKIEEEASINAATSGTADDDDEDEGEITEKPSLEAIKKSKIKVVQDGFGAQIQILSQHISYLWIALARIHRRIQGQGYIKSDPPVGMRGLFIQARQRGRLTSDVYVEMSNLEWDVYQEDVATKIYERGARLFPEQEDYLVEYLKHLHKKRDFTNARVVFSQTVKRFKAKPELIPKLRPIFAYFHHYTSRFGELAQVKELEKQMAELFPEDPKLTYFTARFDLGKFNPITTRVIISSARQMRLKTIMQSVEGPPVSDRSTPRPALQTERSPQPQFFPAVNSPKRPFQADDQDEYPPRKLARGVSPLKGAAGRRLDQQRRAQQGQGVSSHTSGPTPIPRDIAFLLTVIPPAEAFRSHHFSTEGLVRLIQNTAVPSYVEWKARGEGASRNILASSHAHTRQASSEYQNYPYSTRDSPGPSGRPASPYSGISRGVAQASAPYRNSPLRPDSSGSYEPPPPVYQAGVSQFNPLTQNIGPGNAAFAAWQGNYAPPGQYNAGPSQQHPQQYGGYY
ncbi:uncharacterized protein F4817DRAFT_360146 [Daldinia loculata]|uniref:uncharacterized protein n=1 Tax=Daldinia loculata TaxID=103429 RepID=UPI0020C55521|nr:uncharacterized protein F4817DRAFT_360146 [Daldinia loculata]KAI1645255.1 hypothetical protein F4817DRAFT_360146 [Daldinia loculata]